MKFYKQILLITLTFFFLAISSCVSGISADSAVEFSANLGAGWNLGNTLDAWSGDKNNESVNGLNSETCWGMPFTTQDMLKDVRKKGFKTIRIPVSWHNHITETENYLIDPEWMNRVKEIVDWAVEEDFYIILNIHHDNIKSSEFTKSDSIGFALSGEKTIQEKSKKYISKIWTQIATTFAEYDEKLIFEILNEPRDVGSVKWQEWWLQDASEPNAVITSYEQAGLDAIRAVPGNEERYVLVPAYAGSGDWTILSSYKMPKDSAVNKLLLETHGYTPNEFALGNMTKKTLTDNDKNQINWMFNQLKSNFIDMGIGVVMDEASCSNKNNLAERKKWFTHYMKQAKSSGIPVVLWDNMTYSNSGDPGEAHGYYNRKEGNWWFSELISIMVNTLN